MEAFIGSIILFAGNFAPRGWAFCDGQLLSIAQNSALFAILGTTYGGNGTTTFALPDLRGRVPLHVGGGGSSPGLSSHVLGESSGSETVTLLQSQMPAHNHTLLASGTGGNSEVPTDGILAKSTDTIYQAPPVPDTTLAANAVQPTGGSQPHNNMQPYLGLNYIIALEGIFPSRN